LCPVHKGFVMFTVFDRYKALILYSFPAIGYAVLIFLLSSIPGHSIPNLPFFSFDKMVHTLEFGLFGMLLYRLLFFHLRVGLPYFFTIVIGSSYAVLDEFHQYFVPGRACSINDFFADFIGLVVFTGVSAYLNVSKKEQR